MFYKLIKRLIKPVIFIIIFSYLNNHTNLFEHYFADPLVINYIYYVSGIGIWITIGWILSVLVNVILWDEIFRKRKKIEPPDVIETLTSIVIFTLSVMGIIGIVFDQSVTAIWATASVAGGIIGFAIKNLIADFFTGIAINLDRNFKVGDWVKVLDESGEPVVGWIEEITWRTTRVGQSDGSMLIIPNNQIADQAFRNLSINGSERRFEADLFIDPSIDSDKVLRVLTAATRSVPDILTKKHSSVRMSKLTPKGVKYKIKFWVDPTVSAPKKVKSQLNYAILQDRKSTRLNSSHSDRSRMPSSA